MIIFTCSFCCKSFISISICKLKSLNSLEIYVYYFFSCWLAFMVVCFLVCDDYLEAVHLHLWKIYKRKVMMLSSSGGLLLLPLKPRFAIHWDYFVTLPSPFLVTQFQFPNSAANPVLHLLATKLSVICLQRKPDLKLTAHQASTSCFDCLPLCHLPCICGPAKQ